MVGRQCIVLEVNSRVCLLITHILKVEMVVIASLQTPGCPFGEDGRFSEGVFHPFVAVLTSHDLHYCSVGSPLWIFVYFILEL